MRFDICFLVGGIETPFNLGCSPQEADLRQETPL